MNAVEIEEAVSELVAKPFDGNEFPFDFLIAFNAKATTVKRLRKGDTNASDVARGILWGKNIHLAVAPTGQVDETFAALRGSAKTASQKAKFILATDGDTVEAEDLLSGDVVACAYADLPRHFATFLPLAGISAVKEIKNNPVDIKATGRLNRLYVQLLKDNPGWEGAEKRPQLNQFMAQLIFCFFAEDTDIFHGSYKFTPTVERMTSGHSDNTQAVIAELFRAMGTTPKERAAGDFPTWADGFPYVNGGYLFAGEAECPFFSRTARAYLLRAGELDWKEINPDIFGSMIQAVADDGERGELGMHYTSVPNILKVLNPLFLDDLRQQRQAAGESKQKLRNLRKRLSNIRVFDPACGSGNFLVIAYKEMRAIEATIVQRLGGEANLKLEERRSVIPLSNFYGIEIRGFAAEIARLALLIAEFQADCLYLSQQEARAMVLPLHKTGQITVGNALREDWLRVCPPVATLLLEQHDLAGPTGRLALQENELAVPGELETYICGNPPYKGSNWRSEDQKGDLEALFSKRLSNWKSLDYVSGWFLKAADYGVVIESTSAFVSTNSICQGEQVSMLWPLVFASGRQIAFAHRSFKWSNLASHNAGVTVVIIGLCGKTRSARRLFDVDQDGSPIVGIASHINAYLIDGPEVIVHPEKSPLCLLSRITDGSGALDGGYLILETSDRENLIRADPRAGEFIKRYLGSNELINGKQRYCLWITDDDRSEAEDVVGVLERVNRVRDFRASAGTRARTALGRPHRFAWINQPSNTQIVVPTIFSERREFVTADYLPADVIVSNAASIVHDPGLEILSVICSKMHMIWVRSVAGKLEERLRYTSGTCYNTFPLPKLTTQNKSDLTRCAEKILLTREAHFPGTIAELYDPEKMPHDLRRAHDENDEVLERIYVGRRFRNDTERLEKLFDLYTKMTADQPNAKKSKKVAA